MENSFKVIISGSERNRDFALVNSCEYRFICKGNDEKIKWLCSNM